MAVDEMTPEIRQRVFRVLGEGVVQVWSSLPQLIQHDLFESAVRAEGEGMRPQLALLLHNTHPRTTDR